MKLMIVEDERVTRENLGDMLDYAALGFSEVILAINGEDGLKKGLERKPDVILTDIRMPRMDGIVMAQQLRERFPGCQIIFLSAYAELDYYKAAIRLKTVSYLEKPVAASELERILIEAVKDCMKNQKLEQLQNQEKLEKRKPLAYRLSMPNQREAVIELLEEVVDGITLSEYRFVTTMLFTFRKDRDVAEFLPELAAWAEQREAVLLYTKNPEGYFILQVLTRVEQNRFIRLFEEKLCAKLGNESRWYLSVGETVSVGRSYQSYQTAAVGMQKCFFEPYGYVAYPSEKELRQEINNDCRKERIEILITLGKFNLQDGLELEAALYRKLQRQKCMVSGKIRGMYYDFFESFFHESELRQLPERKLEEYRQMVRKGEIDRLNCMELHETFVRLLQMVSDFMEEQAGEDSLILMLKKYVEDNFANPQFSLPDVAEHVHLSVSYICVVFKEHTGITINQYLTEVRMKQAQKYLKSARYSLVEISRLVGYQDSGYFGRIFKKTFQMTPIQYRERKGTSDA